MQPPLIYVVLAYYKPKITTNYLQLNRIGIRVKAETRGSNFFSSTLWLVISRLMPNGLSLNNSEVPGWPLNVMYIEEV